MVVYISFSASSSTSASSKWSPGLRTKFCLVLFERVLAVRCPSHHRFIAMIHKASGIWLFSTWVARSPQHVKYSVFWIWIWSLYIVIYNRGHECARISRICDTFNTTKLYKVTDDIHCGRKCMHVCIQKSRVSELVLNTNEAVGANPVPFHQWEWLLKEITCGRVKMIHRDCNKQVQSRS